MASTKKSKKKNVKVRSTPTTKKKSQSFSLSSRAAVPPKKSKTRKLPPQSMLPLEPVIRRKKHPLTVKMTPTSTVTNNKTTSKGTTKRCPGNRDTKPERIAMYLQLQEREYASSLKSQPSSTACHKRKRPFGASDSTTTTTTTKKSDPNTAIQLQPATFSSTPTTLQMIQQTTESFQNHPFVVDTTIIYDNDNGGVPVQQLARQLISLGTTETAKSMFQSNDDNDGPERRTKRRKLSIPNNNNNPFECLQELHDDDDNDHLPNEKKPFFAFLPATTLARPPVAHDAPTATTNNESTDPPPPRPNTTTNTNQFGFAFHPPKWSVTTNTTSSHAPSLPDATTVPTTIDDATPSTIVSSSSPSPSPLPSLTLHQNPFHHTDPDHSLNQDIDPDL